jgi:hypothetical protein
MAPVPSLRMDSWCDGPVCVCFRVRHLGAFHHPCLLFTSVGMRIFTRLRLANTIQCNWSTTHTSDVNEGGTQVQVLPVNWTRRKRACAGTFGEPAKRLFQSVRQSG